MKKFILTIAIILITALCAACADKSQNVLGSGEVYFPVYKITAPAEGKVLGLILEVGDRIGKEQPLFAVDDQQLAGELKNTAADVARAEAMLKAMQGGGSQTNNAASIAAAQQRYNEAAAQETKMAALYKQGAIARRMYEQAAAAKAGAAAALSAAQNVGQHTQSSPEEIAQKEKELAALKQKYNALMQKQLALETESPCTGTVTEKFLNTGDIAAAGQQVLTIRALENCSAVVKISAQAAQGLKVGQQLTARSESLNKNFNAAVSKIEGENVTVNIDNTSLDLREGMQVTLSLPQ